MLVPLKNKEFKLAPLGEVKSETRLREKGNEINQEMFFEQYKMVDGVQEAYKLTILRDGKAYLEGNLTEAILHTQKVDDSVFQQP